MHIHPLIHQQFYKQPYMFFYSKIKHKRVNFLTTNIKSKIPPIKVNNHLSKITGQNFSSIRRLMK